MKVAGSTDLARMLTQQRHNAAGKASLDRAALEMSTGLKADKVKASGGDVARLFAFDRMLERNAAHVNTIRIAELRLETMQAGLGRAQHAIEGLALDLLSAANLGDMTSGRSKAAAARDAFAEIVTLLNGQMAGASLFAGAASSGPALRPPEDILVSIAGLVDGMSPEDARAAIAAYFDPPSLPFLGDHYLGSQTDLPAAEIGDNQRIGYTMKATEPDLVRTMKGLALAALVAEGAPFAGADPAERAAFMAAAGKTLLDAKEGLLVLRSRVGAAQEIVETALATRRAERESVEMARARLLAADPYDAAATFQAMQVQLENVYTVTARLASLRFANFMR